MAKLKLISEKKVKIRSGIYLEKELLEKVKEVARQNRLSINETMVQLIKKGMNS